MKTLLASIVLSFAAMAQAGTIPLRGPSQPFTLNPSVGCASTASAPFTADQVTVTGFSADGNSVLGQVSSQFGCGCPGRGCIHHYQVCTYLVWDLNGNLLSTTTPTNGLRSLPCPEVALQMPPTQPPAQTVIGNQFANASGYTAETLVSSECGSLACYGTYYNPTLLTP